jgi:hypothetical protein
MKAKDLRRGYRFCLELPCRVLAVEPIDKSHVRVQLDFFSY